MSKGRLTRQELSWLLTQEAQNAAERLRLGVQFLRMRTPPPPADSLTKEVGAHEPAGAHHHVDASLDALDDVMKMLSSLNQRQSSPHIAAVAPRRGRIDLASLIVEIAPEARVTLAPGSGTEVYGEESDFRRMLQVLIGAGEGSSITVRRDDDEVCVGVTLGPEMSPTATTERAWLSRMALRYGGRHELEGGTERLILPADKDSERTRTDRESVREEVARISSMPPAPVAAPNRFEAITKICGGVASELRVMAGAHMPALEALVATLGSIGTLRANELPTDVDLLHVAQQAARDGSAFGEANGNRVTVHGPDAAARVYVRAGAKTVAALAREIVAHAVAASPRGASVAITVDQDPSGPRLVVDDAGPSVPASGRRAFVALDAHADRYGRPSGLPLFLAAELAACMGARLELSDPPGRQHNDGAGFRVAVTFAAPA